MEIKGKVFIVTGGASGLGEGTARMLAAQGEYRFICDADLAMPIEEIAKFLPPTQPGGSFDIAIASRELPGAVRYGEPVYRHIMGRVFNWLVRLLAVPGIQDTQCGFKMFTKEAAQTLFPLQRIDGWGFDVEVLYIARRRGMRLTEAPINWYYQRDSRVRPCLLYTSDAADDLLCVDTGGRRIIK